MFTHIHILSWLHGLPPELLYIVVFIVVGIESLGIPLPGEVTLMGAALLASKGIVDPGLVWLAGASGAILGDSTGYLIGRHYGYSLLRKLKEWFPHHFNAHTVSLAEKTFRHHGTKVVFFGRFIAILRIFAGPLSGILKLPYRRFLLANASGGIVWSGLAVWLVYFLGVIAAHWLKRLSWIALGIALILGIIISIFFRRRVNAYLEKQKDRK